MKRVLAIWLPNWPIQRLVLSRPELARRALVLHGPARRGECATACSPAAQRAGVAPGIPLAEAMALLSAQASSDPLARKVREGVFKPHDPAADRAELIELAQWCHRFSPSVGIEEGDAPETLLLDATNLAPLDGGEQTLLDEAARALRRRRLAVRLALADTVGAAWALAHYAPLGPGLCSGNLQLTQAPSSAAPQAAPGASDDYTPLPLAALRLPADMLQTLAHLGLACVGDALALPRSQLRSRFGPLLLERIDQLTGAAPEVISAVDPPEEWAVEQTFEYPLARGEAIRAAVERLLERLVRRLAARRAGALAVACRLECDGAPAVEFQFGVFRPTAGARHLLEIADLQLERLRLAAPAAAIEVRVLRHAPLAERQGMLFDQQPSLDSSRPLAALIDRLAGRLGREAVVRCRLVSDAQPELAYRKESLVGVGVARPAKRRPARRPKAARPSKELRGPGALDRPLCLLARPAPLEMASVVPEGPPIHFRYRGRRHDVARHWGPERIETGWWRRQRAVRDYYRVETTEGRRFWLFRRRDARWFLHGSYE